MQGRVLTDDPWMLAAGSKRLQARAQLTVKRFMGFWRDRLMGMLSFGDSALRHAVQSAKVSSSPVFPLGPLDIHALVARLNMALGPIMSTLPYPHGRFLLQQLWTLCELRQSVQV